MDTCTVAALDAIAAFAVPKPRLLLAESAGFFRVWLPLQVTLTSRSPSLLRNGKVLFHQSFQPSTRDNLNSWLIDVNAILSRKTNICE